MNATVEAFKQAMLDAGLQPPAEIIADGTLHRFHVESDKSRSENGWYLLHADDPPAGVFGCWKRGISETWSCKAYQSMTTAKKRPYTFKMEAANSHLEEERERIQAECRKRYFPLWDQALPAKDSHPYLLAKQVKAYGLKWNRGALLVPIRDIDSILYGLQKIWRTGDGGKYFELGTIVTGHFHVIGTMTREAIIICEGYATGASIYQATGLTVLVAFDAGNLNPVAEEVRKRRPTVKIMICADNDQWNDDGINRGIKAATEAARAIGGSLAIPAFRETITKPTDFNDLHFLEGLAEVRCQLERQGVNGV